MAGKLNFIAGLIPPLKPFVAPLWRACSPDGTDDAPASSLRRRRRIPNHLVHVTRYRNAIRWLLAFLSRQRGSLVRRYPLVLQVEHLICFTCDASPWGIGAVLYRHGRPVGYYYDSITTIDLNRFRAKLGDSAFLTIWEALAILVALRVWRDPSHRDARVAIRSDSLGAILATARGASPNPGINLILRELALEDAEFGSRIHTARHIPGMSNDLADALSRMSAPDAHPLPEALKALPRTPVPTRRREWWLTAQW